MFQHFYINFTKLHLYLNNICVQITIYEIIHLYETNLLINVYITKRSIKNQLIYCLMILFKDKGFVYLKAKKIFLKSFDGLY